MSENLERETDYLESQLARARKTDKRQKWGLFALAMISLILAAILGVFLVNAWAENEAERRATANEQVEKQEIAQEAQKALCQAGDTEIYDRDLCARLDAVAAEAPRSDPGPEGPRGPQGPRGPEGAQGPEGEPGARGPAGEQGPPGDDGSDGDDGTPGVMGLPGLDGVSGADGSRGPVGPEGPVGPVGAQGPPGEPGPVGEPGVAGPPGANGADGINGADGAPGPEGPPGAPGPAGEPGAPGAQGVSIVDVDCVGEGQDSTWQITLSDGQVLNGGGPCKSNGPPIEIGAP